MTGEFEPKDSRNVTGTASTPDGRWTGQSAEPPLAAGQSPQQPEDQPRNQQGGGRMDSDEVSDDELEDEDYEDEDEDEDESDSQSGTGGQAGSSGAALGQGSFGRNGS